MFFKNEVIKLKDRITVTTLGWDGTGYDGEGKERPVYTMTAHPGKLFIKARYKTWCYLVVTDEVHPKTGLRIASFHSECVK